MAKKYLIFDHTADLGVEVYGKTPEELFANAAFAVFDIITDISTIRIAQERAIVVEGLGWEDLLVNYLREILYLFNGEGLLLKEYVIVKIEPCFLKAVVKGEGFNGEKHRIKTEIKAVTYHQASVTGGSQKWTGRVIFDV